MSKRVVNYVATSDWVVAIFPKLFEINRIQDLGSAGHDRFDPCAGHCSAPIDRQAYVDGAHSAALVESNWNHVAKFLVDGLPPSQNESLMKNKRRWWAVLAGIFCAVIWVVLIAVIVFIFPKLLCAGADALSLEEWEKTLVLVAYAALV